MLLKTRFPLLAALLLPACAAGPPFIDAIQPEAISLATRRAQVELNCPAVTAELISREMTRPVSMDWSPEDAEFTVGVAGCGKRASYVVICSQNTQGCFAGGGRTVIQ